MEADRTPRPGTYVRLVDVEELSPFVTALLAVGSFGVHRVSRRPGAHRVAGWVGGGLLAVSLLATAVAAVWIVSHQSPSWNPKSECWSFASGGE